MAKKVLVMGGTRFVGLHAVRELVKRGYEVTVLNRGSRPEVLPPVVRQVRCDRKDESLLKETLRSILKEHRFDAVFDPSAYVPSDVAPVVEVMKGEIGAYVFISTGSVYKARGIFPWYEDMPRVADLSTGAYGYNKRLCEDVFMEAHGKWGFPVTMIRPGYIYGPHNTVYREAYFFDRIVKGRPVLLPGTGAVLTQFGYVDDLANLVILAMENPKACGQAYNFAGKTQRPLDDYVRACALAVSAVQGRDLLAEIIHYWPEDVGIADKDVGKLFPYRWRVNTVRDISKARYELGYDEHWTLEQGLTEAYRWYLGETGGGRRLFPDPDYGKEDSILAALGG